ncbi:hypothetical protein [Cohnella cellulosilytica]|uniref:hypothetical protein n=1 Tax=Cohnella cellulosilytica TaxID=986710 RepID=UPI003671CA78
MFDGDNLIAANPSKIDLSGYDEEAIIKGLTSSLSLNDTQYTNSIEITTVCNSLMGHLLDNVKELISSNPKGYLLSIMNAI